MRRIAVEKRLLAQLVDEFVKRPAQHAEQRIAEEVDELSRSSGRILEILRMEANDLVIAMPVEYRTFYESIRVRKLMMLNRLSAGSLPEWSGDDLATLSQVAEALRAEAGHIDAANDALAAYVRKRFPW